MQSIFYKVYVPNSLNHTLKRMCIYVELLDQIGWAVAYTDNVKMSWLLKVLCDSPIRYTDYSAVVHKPSRKREMLGLV